MAAVCEAPNRQGRSTHRCGKDARWLTPSGEVKTILLWHPSLARSVSGCCADRWRPTAADIRMQNPGWPEGYSPVPEEPPSADELGRQRWHRWALTDIAPAKTSGLMKQDGSEAERIVRRVG